MTDRTPESFRDFCILMLGSSLQQPLKPRGADDIINGATISALVEAFEKTHPVAQSGALPGKATPANGAHDPLGLRHNRCSFPGCQMLGTWKRAGEMPVCTEHRPPDAEPIS